MPADGSCLFHALVHHFPSVSAADLRAATATHIARNPDMPIADVSLAKWIHADTGLGAHEYARRLAGPSFWGGAVELQVIATVLKITIHVYQHEGGNEYTRMCTFGAGPRTAHLVLDSGHYAALTVLPTHTQNNPQDPKFP